VDSLSLARASPRRYITEIRYPVSPNPFCTLLRHSILPLSIVRCAPGADLPTSGEGSPVPALWTFSERGGNLSQKAPLPWQGSVLSYWSFPPNCDSTSSTTSCKMSSSMSRLVPGNTHMPGGRTYGAPGKQANWTAIGFHAARMLEVLLGGTTGGAASCH
jgi:hypothetical protein